MEKEIRRSLVVIPLLLMLGCAQTVKSSQMVRWIQVNERNGMYTCSLYSDKGEVLAKKEGKRLPNVTEKLLDDVDAPAALGLLDAAVIPDSFGYSELLEFASTIREHGDHTPNIRFYVAGNETPEQIAEILDEGNLASCDISRILFDNGGVVIPCLDEQGALACTGKSSEMLQGDDSAIALLLAGERSRLELRESGFFSEWAMVGVDADKEELSLRIECIGCHQKKADTTVSTENIAARAENVIRRVGPEPFLLPEKWRQISGRGLNMPMTIHCTVAVRG